MTESWQTNEGVVVVRLPRDSCLLGSATREFRKRLTDLAEELHRGPQKNLRGVLILQEVPADDRISVWHAELSREALFKDLVVAMYGWRWLLSMIRNSPIPWAFASASSCFGTAFELALSCQRRFWFATHAEIGFPEITDGAFPVGGAIESVSKRSGRTQDKWQAKSTMSALEAVEEGLLHFAAGSRDFSATALAMFEELLRRDPLAGVKDSARRRGRAELQFLMSGGAPPKASLDVFEAKKAQIKDAITAWDASWEVLKERGRFRSGQELGWALAHICARHLLSYKFLRALEARVATSSVGVGLSRSLPDLVGVDLDHLTPPTESLVRLARAGVRVMLTASESEPLAVAINLIYSRLERLLGGHAAQDVWRQSFAWCQAERLEIPTLRWTVDDRVVAVAGDVRHEYLRLDIVPGAKGAGSLEALVAPDLERDEERKLVALVSLAADKVIPLVGVASTWARSTIVRSHAFEEIVRISLHCDGDLGVVVQQLAECGWRFAGSDDAWGRFLKARIDTFGLDVFPKDTLGPLDRKCWEVGSWKQAQALARRGSKTRRWSATQTSQHFATYAGLLATALGGGAADEIVSLALGFPESYGAPQGFFARRGLRRAKHYVGTNWPSLAGGAPRHHEERPK